MRYKTFQFALFALLGTSFVFTGVHICCCSPVEFGIDASASPADDSCRPGGCCEKKDTGDRSLPQECNMRGIFAFVTGPSGADLAQGSSSPMAFAPAVWSDGVDTSTLEAADHRGKGRLSTCNSVPIILLTSVFLI